MKYQYPFGEYVRPLVQEDRSPKKVFVLGVYASAVHARWKRGNNIICQALAVASEPRIFWDGNPDEAREIISGIRIPEALGVLEPAGSHLNGPSAKVLDDHILAPLGYTRSDVWLCDCLPETRLNPSQVKVINERYNPLIKAYGLNEVTIPKRPSAFCDEKRAEEIADELMQSQAELLVLLGDIPIEQFLRSVSDVPYSSLQEYVDLYGYGNPADVTILGRQIKVLPLAHPRQIGALGAHSERWHKAHAEWEQARTFNASIRSLDGIEMPCALPGRSRPVLREEGIAMQYRLTEPEYQRILDFKRDMHMHPELSHHEFRTTEKIKEFLNSIPSCRILPLPVETGVLARIAGSGEGPEIMLRADIDALPQTEQYESPWKSSTPGVMHACGHDFHTASLLGAALLLARTEDLTGSVDLVFQPAEEGTTGARMLIDAGLFDLIHPDYCFGLHNWPSVQSGKIVCHEGALMAAKRNFEIRLYGAGGHGSMPHLNIDPIVCAAAVVQSLQTVVSRNTDPLDSVVLSINLIQGGSPVNLVVDQVMMKATVRSLSEKALDRAIGRVEAIVEKTAQAYECRSEILWNERIPAVYNTPEMTRLARQCAGLTDCEVTDTAPSLASEDFALYRAHVPSFFYWVGSAAKEEPHAEELHRPCFHTDDHALAGAAELLAVSAIKAGGA